MPLSEADTSRTFIIPKLKAAGWENDPRSIAEQRSIPPEELAATIREKEHRIMEIVGRIKALLEKRP